MPWAVYLADGRGRYQLLGSDLDAARGPVVEDVAELCALLAAAEIAPLACAPERLVRVGEADDAGYGEVALRIPGRPAWLPVSVR